MSTPTGPLTGPPNPASALVSLPTEVQVIIIENLGRIYHRCDSCNHVKGIWRTEANFLRLSVTCRHFNDLLRTRAYVPRSHRGNSLEEVFDCCPCTLARINRVRAQMAAEAEMPVSAAWAAREAAMVKKELAREMAGLMRELGDEQAERKAQREAKWAKKEGTRTGLRSQAHK